MRVKILGVAAGGGFPQWNCGCLNCRRLRQGVFSGRARTQAQVAISSDNRNWYLLNASPDLRAQIEASPALHPGDGVRHSPIKGIVLTSGEIDQVIGLLLLREFQPLRVYATASVRRILVEDNSMFGALRRAAKQVEWTDVAPGGAGFDLTSVDGENSGLHCESFALPGSYPGFVGSERTAKSDPAEAVQGLIVEEANGGGRLAYMPAVALVEEGCLERLERCDTLLFDGTFWTDDELVRVHGGGRTAREMGHLPVSGPGGVLERLGQLRRPRKIFLHVNNTNPMLDEDSPEYRCAREAGWEVPHDGLELEL
ncbi:MAG: pyrroloquinoline quinone biosynthesis protein PqqB [Acidobacteria bacterium]|nr:pyrroloquinoline quinone biosynthesis protein PqqB [Acidobacteriota bacterium]